MSGLEDLYREIILDHYRSPRNRGELPVPPAKKLEGFNPLCGDEIVLYVDVDESAGTVSDIRIDKTAPAAPTGSRSPEANAAGWNNQSPVTVSFGAQGDVGAVQSGIDECTASEDVSGETAGTSVVGTCTDRAGTEGCTANR